MSLYNNMAYYMKANFDIIHAIISPRCKSLYLSFYNFLFSLGSVVIMKNKAMKTNTIRKVLSPGVEHNLKY